MSGLFGGVVGVANFFGGLILSLLIGSAKGNSQTSTVARMVRLTFGAIIIGLIIATVLYVFKIPMESDVFGKPRYGAAFVEAPIFSIFGIWILEFLRNIIK